MYLTLAGSLISAGLKKVITTLVENNMVDAIVSTGAIMIDQDFFEALGFKHYKGSAFADDNELQCIGSEIRIAIKLFLVLSCLDAGSVLPGCAWIYIV